MRERDIAPRPSNRLPGQAEHFQRDVDAMKPRGRIKARHLDQVPSRAAPQFKHAAIAIGPKVADQPVPSEEEDLAGGVVDVFLPAIDIVHAIRMVLGTLWLRRMTPLEALRR